jgi:hypothetical protein
VAAPGAGAAATESACRRRILGRDHTFCPEEMDCAFVQRLRELGWIEGRTIAIEYRWAEGRNEPAPEIFAEFVRLKVDVIVTHPTPLALAAKQATSLIPIVFAVAGDPVGTGLVASLARPGGNVTGLSLQITDTVSKRLELLREVVPGLRHLAMMANIGNPIAVLEKRGTATMHWSVCCVSRCLVASLDRGRERRQFNPLAMSPLGVLAMRPARSSALRRPPASRSNHAMDRRQLGQLRAISAHAADLFAIDRGRARGFERLDLAPRC